MFRTLLQRFRHRGSSTQFEVQRMTPAGGWVNFYTDFVDDPAKSIFRTPPDPLSFSSDSSYPEGRYRCIERIDGRISGVRWTVESPNCEQFYENQRKKKRQHDQLEGMSIDEVREELRNRNSLTTLSRIELLEALIEKMAENRSRNS